MLPFSHLHCFLIMLGPGEDLRYRAQCILYIYIYDLSQQTRQATPNALQTANVPTPRRRLNMSQLTSQPCQAQCDYVTTVSNMWSAPRAIQRRSGFRGANRDSPRSCTQVQRRHGVSNRDSDSERELCIVTQSVTRTGTRTSRRTQRRESDLPYPYFRAPKPLKLEVD